MAKIISVPFAEQLFDYDHIVSESRLLDMVLTGISKAKDKDAFISNLFNKLKNIDEITFLRTFYVDRTIFLKTLLEKVQIHEE